MDVLRIAPSIRVQNDQISMMGKSSISVMVDDRQILLSGEDMINFLKNIKLDNIKSIEVITNPPAKYETEGNSGIVDIKLKKARANSWSNTTRTSYIQAIYPSFSIGNSFSYQKNKLSLLFDISVSPYTRIYTNESKYDYPKEYWKNNIYNKARIHPISGLLNLGYDVSKNLRIGFQYLGNMSHLKKDKIGTANAYNRGVGDLKKLIQTTADYYNHSFNGNLLKKLDTLGKQLSLDVDYFAYKADRNNLLNAEYKSYLWAVSKKEYIENLNLQKINNFSTKIDFDMLYEWARLSFGGNPARWYLTANSYEEGNPFLQPSFTSDVEVSHTYSKTREGFGQLILHDLQNDIQSFIGKNYYDYDNFVCSEYIQHAVFAWWRASAEASIYYSETKAYSEYLNPQYYEYN
ncbi:outer membrane beta-barrel protein [Elizabethkingia argentiflava]|uniref:Outer membrane beta-barrel protein n=1 Tax=Elizabethkingia argenteiflava TaxID=2681556 RepID=A0A845PRI5_9FLAO|nr:Plug domain-containing protein [Elizabethkingia argenteiflava]NAW50275.1 outer membrane beta-barrel protein [Elizabethkingia argenteiflava]